MAAEGATPGGRLKLRGTTFGEAAMAAFVLCAVSGVLLVPAYDATDAKGSIAGWLLANPAAEYLRSIHYWTAQIFLVGTVLHAWDHLRVAERVKLAGGVWLRVVLSLPVILLLMLSGFLLRGDADAQQAQRILHEIILGLPLVGALLAAFLFGAGEPLDVVYVHHAATATIIVGLIIIEHVRRIWPRGATMLLVGVPTIVISLVLSPGLHDGLDPRMKGPWYFLGLQELLHWSSTPTWTMLAGMVGLAAIWVLPRLRSGRARQVGRGLVVVGAVYAILCVVALFQRGENWSWRTNWPDGASDLRRAAVGGGRRGAPAVLPAKLPVVLGRTEGCLVCHAGLTGLGESHRPESIGCASCHLGDVYALDAERAHAGMVRVPGNLADARLTCGQAGCHQSIVPRVERSIMTTFAGVITVDRDAFGEKVAGGMPPHVRDLGTSAADSHLRQLCASCHLGQAKEAWGAIDEASRGGGCSACHLSYSSAAMTQLDAYVAQPLGKRAAIPTVHPELTIRAGGGTCFGCHSRSGRIATNYEGWHELREPPAQPDLVGKDGLPPVHRRLADDRVFVRMTPDVHHERGMECTDCHTANEVMGQGAVVGRKHEQQTLRCEDCHTRQWTTLAVTQLDEETRKRLRLRAWTPAPKQRLATTRSGDPLVNVMVDAGGRGGLRTLRDGRERPLLPPKEVCAQGRGHARLSCESCHAAWAPRCASCHTTFDRQGIAFDHVSQREVRGAWREESGAFEAVPPTLGITRDKAHPDGVVEIYVPGMIMTLDRGPSTEPVFQRRYARTAAHTTRREARSCASCHADPVALGFGRGTLTYERDGATGMWRFIPAHEIKAEDGLPADAWVGFLQTRSGDVSTRDDVRPFSAEEQRRILRAGACLTCHAGDSEVMRRALADMDLTWRGRGPRCSEPMWPAAER